MELSSPQIKRTRDLDTMMEDGSSRRKKLTARTTGPGKIELMQADKHSVQDVSVDTLDGKDSKRTTCEGDSTTFLQQRRLRHCTQHTDVFPSEVWQHIIGLVKPMTERTYCSLRLANKQLHYLTMQAFPRLEGELKNDASAYLAHFILSKSSDQIHPQWRERLPGVKEIKIDGVSLHDVVRRNKLISFLQLCPDLEVLQLSACSLGPSGVSALPYFSLQKLRHLNLRNNNLGDKVWRVLPPPGSCKALKEICMVENHCLKWFL